MIKKIQQVRDELRLFLSPLFSPETVVECKHCGTTLDHDTASCSACGSQEIARYEL
jgi:rRNA maturation endonuclease Nob1